MPWFNLSFNDFIKRKISKFLINRYFSRFFEEKLTSDQICLDLYNGKGSVYDVKLCCEVRRNKQANHNNAILKCTNNETDDYDDKQQNLFILHFILLLLSFSSYKTCFFLFAISFVFLPIKCVIAGCMSGLKSELCFMKPA